MENQKKISDTLRGKKQKNGKRKTKEHGHASIGRKTEKLKTQKTQIILQKAHPNPTLLGSSLPSAFSVLGFSLLCAFWGFLYSLLCVKPKLYSEQ